jgi:hypothetical protein
MNLDNFDCLTNLKIIDLSKNPLKNYDKLSILNKLESINLV